MCSIQPTAVIPEFDEMGKFEAFEKAMLSSDESWIDSYLENPGIMTTGIDGSKRFITVKPNIEVMCPFGFAIFSEKYNVAKKILDKYPELAHNSNERIEKPLDAFFPYSDLSAINLPPYEWPDNAKSLFTFVCNNHFYSPQIFCGNSVAQPVRDSRLRSLADSQPLTKEVCPIMMKVFKEHIHKKWKEHFLAIKTPDLTRIFPDVLFPLIQNYAWESMTTRCDAIDSRDQDPRRSTMLDRAVRRKNVELIVFLRQLGANPLHSMNTQFPGLTILEYARGELTKIREREKNEEHPEVISATAVVSALEDEGNGPFIL